MKFAVAVSEIIAYPVKICSVCLRKRTQCRATRTDAVAGTCLQMPECREICLCIFIDDRTVDGMVK